MHKTLTERDVIAIQKEIRAGIQPTCSDGQRMIDEIHRLQDVVGRLNRALEAAPVPAADN